MDDELRAVLSLLAEVKATRPEEGRLVNTPIHSSWVTSVQRLHDACLTRDGVVRKSLAPKLVGDSAGFVAAVSRLREVLPGAPCEFGARMMPRGFPECLNAIHAALEPAWDAGSDRRGNTFRQTIKRQDGRGA